MERVVVVWLVAAGLVALVLTGFDKVRARRGGPRVRERTLLGWAAVGGSPGLVAGMLLFHHKTRKVSFLARVAAVVFVQAALVFWLAPRWSS